MQFEYDIYISYSKADNKPLSSNNRGWVSNFHKYLEVRLSQLLGEKPKFLHYANEEKPSEAELKKACLLITVVSPEYVKSADCVEDIEVFYTHAEKEGKLTIQEKSRIFKIVKAPVSFEAQPSKINTLLSYDMFETDSTTGESKEITNFFGEEAEKNFWMRLDDLAHDVYDIISKVKIERGSNKVQDIETGESVYLAETGFDINNERDLIKRELQRHGYRVLPDHTLPTNVREMEAVIKKDLKDCKLSIHMIGDSYGEIPKGADRSIVDIQNQLAAEHSSHVGTIPGAGKGTEFNRLIWVSPNAKLSNEKQKVFIENLKRDAESISGAELLQTSLEVLKNIIRNELSGEDSVGRPSREEEVSASGLPKVYVIYDKSDLAGGKELSEMIKGRGHEVLTPLSQGDLMEVRNHHLESLRTCDVALIYYGNVNEQWLQVKVLDLLKAPGLGRSKPLIAKAIFKEKGPKLNQKNFNNYDVAIIENTNGMVVSMEPFMAKINKVKNKAK